MWRWQRRRFERTWSWQMSSTSQSHSLPFFSPLLFLLFQMIVFMKHQRVGGTNHILLPTSEILNAATSMFSLSICHTEMRDHVSAVAEQRVNMCCTYTHQLYSVRWVQYTCKAGLPLAVNPTYPYKTLLTWDTELFCTCLVRPFIQDFQTLGNPVRAIDMVEEMSKNSRQTDRKRYHKSDEADTLSRGSMGRQICNILPDAVSTYENSNNAKTQT